MAGFTTAAAEDCPAPGALLQSVESDAVSFYLAEAQSSLGLRGPPRRMDRWKLTLVTVEGTIKVAKAP